MKHNFRTVVISALLLLTACGTSPRTRFLSLEPGDETTHAFSLHGPAITVGKVTLPPELDRTALVVRTGPNDVEIRHTEQWAGPLDEMVRDTLALDLARRLNTDSVLLRGQTVPKERVRPITVVIERFSAGPDDRVSLWARWSLYSRGGHTRLLDDSERIQVKAQSLSGQHVAHAMSQALAELSNRMAMKIQGI